MLRCLTEKQDDIKNEACKKEVFYYEKMEVQNYHNDVILAAACRADVDKFCKDIQPGGCCQRITQSALDTISRFQTFWAPGCTTWQIALVA